MRQFKVTAKIKASFVLDESNYEDIKDKKGTAALEYITEIEEGNFDDDSLGWLSDADFDDVEIEVEEVE